MLSPKDAKWILSGPHINIRRRIQLRRLSTAYGAIDLEPADSLRANYVPFTVIRRAPPPGVLGAEKNHSFIRLISCNDRISFRRTLTSAIIPNRVGHINGGFV